MIIPTLFLTSKIWGDPQWARGFDYMLLCGFGKNWKG